MPAIKHYAVFGGCLQTDIEFPELLLTQPRMPMWTLKHSSLLPEHGPLTEIGAQHIYGDVHARLFRHAAGFRITVDDTGTFDIDTGGTHITCVEKDGAWPDFVRAHVLGRVLATALYSRGWMPLHGSAVQFGGGVAGFLAPKRFGKSTLALALTRAGGKLVTDDTLPIELSRPLMSWPGVHSVRVASDSLAAMGMERADLPTREGKGVITSLTPGQLADAAAPVSAIYLLHPEGSQAGRRIIREKLPSAPAALSLVANFKLARMMGPAEMPEVLRRASVIADGVPVYRLSLPRDFSALPAVVETIRAWHDPDVAPGLSRASA